METNTLKVDLDMYFSLMVEKLLVERIQFLINVGILEKDIIEKIELYKKSKYSVKIYLNKFIADPKDLILIQSILGDDYKRTAITFRDYKLGLRNWNRMFDIKRYENGEYKEAKVWDITNKILPLIFVYED